MAFSAGLFVCLLYQPEPCWKFKTDLKGLAGVEPKTKEKEFTYKRGALEPLPRRFSAHAQKILLRAPNGKETRPHCGMGPAVVQFELPFEK